LIWQGGRPARDLSESSARRSFKYQRRRARSDAPYLGVVRSVQDKSGGERARTPNAARGSRTSGNRGAFGLRVSLAPLSGRRGIQRKGAGKTGTLLGRGMNGRGMILPNALVPFPCQSFPCPFRAGGKYEPRYLGCYEKIVFEHFDRRCLSCALALKISFDRVTRVRGLCAGPAPG
jgi:hypothetical protein